MSGPWQHHIPQSLQRGFRVRGGSKKTSKVWLFEKGRAPVLEFVKKIGAAVHFYSTPSLDGSKTLDEQITSYELASFDLAFHHLKNSEPGTVVDSTSAAKVVEHLTIRGDHLRKILSEASRKVFTDAIDLFCNETNMRPLLGLDTKSPPDKFTRALDEFLGEHPEFRNILLPTHVLSRIAHTIAREGFNKFFLSAAPLMLALLTKIIEQAPSFVREGHNKALASSLEPTPRTDILRQFIWTVRISAAENFILPDCVALGLEVGGNVQPLMMADLAKCKRILMPLSNSTILVGVRSAAEDVKLADFNKFASMCSHQFFIAGSDKFARLATNIGMTSKRFMRDEIGTIINEFKKSRSIPPSISATYAKNEIFSESTLEPNVQAPQYSVHFRDCADQETANRIAANIFFLTSELGRSMPLERLDGITIAYDYTAALRELDRGSAATPLEPTNEEFGTSVAMAPSVIRDGIRKTHIVIRAEIGHSLIGENEIDRKFALQILVQQLAHVACAQMFEERLPNAKIDDSFEAFLYSYADSAWRNYFSARISGGFNPEINGYCEMVAAVIRRAHSDLVAARLNYYSSKDIDKLMAVALPRVHDILRFSATLLGQHDGVGALLLEKQPAFDAYLKNTGLRDWFLLFDSELSELWLRRSEWLSFDEFLVLNRHVERLLWQHGLFPWKMDDGQIRVEVRLVTDIDRSLASA